MSIGQSVGTNDNVQFNNVTVGGLLNTDDITATTLTASGNVIVSGNLTVNGTTTTVNSNTVNIGDNILVLNSDETGTPSQNAGFEVERGTEDNVSFLWDETNDRWTTGNKNILATTFIGNLSGNATTVTNGIYTSSSVTDLSDVSSVGSGAIITSAERTKLTNIEALVDVTDATNVAAAGAVMNTGDETIAGTKNLFIYNSW